MIDKEFKRNGSGYYDPTAYEALGNYRKENETMKAKEIWEIKQNNGKYQDVLVLAVNGDVATCLNLMDQYASNRIEIICQGMKYVDTRKLQFTFEDTSVNFIRSLTDEEYDIIMNDVAVKLGIDRKTVIQKVEVPVEVKEEPKKAEMIPTFDMGTIKEIERAKTERDIYKGLYEKLLADVMNERA